VLSTLLRIRARLREFMQAPLRDLDRGPRKRDFVDLLWQIAEKRCCEEVYVHYDCGHNMKADVWVPMLPKTHAYMNEETDRRRFMQHGMYVLTKNPGARKVQITVHEGRCRLCQRGQRQALICGPLQMDLTERGRRTSEEARKVRDPRVQTLLAPARRLELPLSSHVFLSAMGQVCRFPDDISLPLLQSSALGTLKLMDTPRLSHEGLRQWTRKEIEDELKAEVVKYVGASCLLVLVMVGCLLCLTLDSASAVGPGSFVPTFNSSDPKAAVNATWVSTITLTLQRAQRALIGADPLETETWLWPFWGWALARPLWIVSFFLSPVFWAFDLVLALPRFIVTTTMSMTHSLLWSFLGRFLAFTREVLQGTLYVVVRTLTILGEIPKTNPMVVASVLSLLIAAFSAPPTVSLGWSDLPSVEFTSFRASRAKSLGLFAQLRAWARGHRSKKDFPTAKGRERSHGRDCSTRPDKGRHDCKGGSSRPACFLCLDRPSRYAVEPCGHRVTCAECTVQLVEAAVRNRTSEPPEKGGACPFCSTPVSRAMRVF